MRVPFGLILWYTYFVYYIVLYIILYNTYCIVYNMYCIHCIAHKIYITRTLQIDLTLQEGKHAFGSNQKIKFISGTQLESKKQCSEIKF